MLFFVTLIPFSIFRVYECYAGQFIFCEVYLTYIMLRKLDPFPSSGKGKLILLRKKIIYSLVGDFSDSAVL
jgi:hypothetical protein